MGYDELQAAPPKKQRGCFFYGCIISIVLVVVLVVVIAGSLYALYRYAINTAKEYTETVAATMPPVAMPEPQRVELRKKVETFGKELEARTATEPIVLTADDLNALIDDNANFKGKAHVDIVGDKVTAKISFPLSDLKLPFKELDGRYLNGSATLRVTLLNGVLDVRADSIEAKGKPLPEEFVASLRNKNLAEKSLDDPKAREALDKIESIIVKDGKIIVTPRPTRKPEAPKEETSKDETPKDAAKDEAAKEAPDKDAKPPAETPDDSKKPEKP